MPDNSLRCTKGSECCYVSPPFASQRIGPIRDKCPHLIGERCGLRDELGSWEAVHSDPRYLEFPAPVWREKGIADCGDYFCDDCLPE